ncbi:MAG: hypothetical protein J6X84_06430 [Treponema sp.]|nr:hypothetical protein [Treponema sp.]
MGKKKLLIIATAIAAFTFKAASENLALPDTTELLLSYIENDSELKNLTIAAKKAALSYDSTRIDKGFDITLASGTINIELSDDNTKVSAKPSVQAKLPQASNLSAEVSTKIDSSDNQKVSDTSISLGIDIISSSNLTNKISLLKAKRSVIEAERKLEKRVLNAEKEFYSELKQLLSSINSIMKSEEQLYSDTIDFEAVKVQGFSTVSSTYRKAQLKVITDQHDIESSLHSFIHDCVVFYKKCGFDIQIDEKTDLMTLVPTDIEYITTLNITDFDKSLYNAIESAEWTYKINSMERKANKNYSLSANAGYTIDNSATNSDSVDAGLTGTLGGLKLGAGVSLPVNQNEDSANSKSSSPAIKLSLSLNPNTFRKNSITKKQNALTEEQELLAIQAAESDYETTIVEHHQKLDTLLWDKKTCQENLSLYEELEKDMAQLFKQGFISESDYLSTKTTLNSCIIKKVMNQIDLIIYNDDVAANFVRNTDGE